MGLHRLDFFSNSPKIFIFHNSSNKTNFGGILTMIYFIIFIAIAFYYFIDYILKEEYSIEYLHYEESEELLDRNEISKLYYNEKLNPNLEFNFETTLELDDDVYSADEYFILLNGTNNQSISLNTSLYKKVTDIEILIIVNETIYEFLQSLKNDYKYNSFSLFISYKGFFLDHQNESSPLHRISEGSIETGYNINLKNPTLELLNWNIIKYKADAGIKKLWNQFIKKKDEESLKTIGLYFNHRDTFSLEDYFSKDFINKYHINGTNYRVLGAIKFDIDFSNYDEYKRTKKDILDSISNACSLCLTFYNIFSFLFITFYSKNFDNYKITEKILFNTKTIKFQNKSRSNSIELRQDYKKTESLLSHSSEDNIMIINDEKTEKYEKENISQDNEEDCIKLPKLKFYEYIFNNVYNKCCKMNNQKIISKCNEIISKYYSIEHILYNQLKLENLFKDYRWNDPALNNYENNELIIDLKNLIDLKEKN